MAKQETVNRGTKAVERKTVERRAVETRTVERKAPVVPQRGLLRFGIVGVGNGGCQIAAKAYEEKGFDAILFNTAQSDMNRIEADLPKFVVGSQGSGKDREEARKYLQQNSEVLSDPVIEKFIRNNDVIVVINTTGGGSGSGIGPFLTMFFKNKASQLGLADDKHLMCVYVTPRKDEGLIAYQNTAHYIQERRKLLTLVPYMCYDNSIYKESSTAKLFERVNSDIVEDLCVLRGDYINDSELESIDTNELLEIIKCPGRIVVFRAANISKRNPKSIDVLLEDSYYDSSIVDIGDNPSGSLMAVISNLDGVMQGRFDINQPIPNLIDPARFVNRFNHIYVPSRNEPNSVYVVVSGLDDPTQKIKEVVDRVEELTSVNDAIDEKDDEIDELLAKATKKVQPKIRKAETKDNRTYGSVDDLFSMFLTD